MLAAVGGEGTELGGAPVGRAFKSRMHGASDGETLTGFTPGEWQSQVCILERSF